MSEALSDDTIVAALAELPGWTYADNRLHKEFKFSNFREAISFIVRMAFYCEAADHHPELTNVYSRVGIALTTHDAGNRVTQKDVDLAAAVEAFAWR